jgi:hypothetical protein
LAGLASELAFVWNVNAPQPATNMRPLSLTATPVPDQLPIPLVSLVVGALAAASATITLVSPAPTAAADLNTSTQNIVWHTLNLCFAEAKAEKAWYKILCTSVKQCKGVLLLHHQRKLCIEALPPPVTQPWGLRQACSCCVDHQAAPPPRKQGYYAMRHRALPHARRSRQGLAWLFWGKWLVNGFILVTCCVPCAECIPAIKHRACLEKNKGREE